jgi:hypothetical protein
MPGPGSGLALHTAMTAPVHMMMTPERGWGLQRKGEGGGSWASGQHTLTCMENEGAQRESRLVRCLFHTPQLGGREYRATEGCSVGYQKVATDSSGRKRPGGSIEGEGQRAEGFVKQSRTVK